MSKTSKASIVKLLYFRMILIPKCWLNNLLFFAFKAFIRQWSIIPECRFNSKFLPLLETTQKASKNSINPLWPRLPKSTLNKAVVKTGYLSFFYKNYFAPSSPLIEIGAFQIMYFQVELGDRDDKQLNDNEIFVFKYICSFLQSLFCSALVCHFDLV